MKYGRKLVSISMLKGWVSGIASVALKCRECVSLWVFQEMPSFGIWFSTLLKKAVFAALICAFALGGAVIGTFAGAIKGQTTETGFLRGSGVGAVTGAITAIQLLQSMVDGESLSKVALLGSIVNGKVFMEWVSPAVLKAYQWQMSTIDTSNRDMSDIYDINGAKGLSKTLINKLPKFRFQPNSETCCSICLQVEHLPS
ncbi:hypothetical protein RJ641_034605 [Dillenia turbinata]|uniref:Uncharacterized protein n=1 Tax=Dillenia turbinata TaxID=194707 RepID=A0AAN8VHR6_9MAGN